MAKKKHIPLQFIIWGNIEKWRLIRGISNEQLAGILGLKKMNDRKTKGFITGDEMDKICIYLEIEPEKLLER